MLIINILYKYHLNNNIVPLSHSIGMGRWDKFNFKSFFEELI